MAIFEQGETYVHRASIRDRTGTLVNPSSASFKLIDPCGYTLVNYQSMTSDATGQYYYNYTLSSTATFGRYITQVKAITSGGNIAHQKGEFFVMPWDGIPEVRRTMGCKDAKTIEDDDLASILWSSYKYALKDVYIHHYDESPNANVETGAYFDGTNSTFQTQYYPIADVNGDGYVYGNEISCASDITVKWRNSYGHMQDGYVSVTRADNGEIHIFQSDGITPIPSTNKGVYLEYWIKDKRYDNYLFQQAVVRLACYELSKRFTSLTEITLADIQNNNPLITIDPQMWMHEYHRYLDKCRSLPMGGL